jgi:hypothetical protein
MKSWARHIPFTPSRRICPVQSGSQVETRTSTRVHVKIRHIASRRAEEEKLRSKRSQKRGHLLRYCERCEKRQPITRVAGTDLHCRYSGHREEQRIQALAKFLRVRDPG